MDHRPEFLMNGDLFRALVEYGVISFDKMTEMFVDLLTSGSRPPGTRPVVDEGREYLRLAELRDQQDPIYWTNPEAQARLAELEQKYGPLVPPIPGAPVPALTTSIQPTQVPTYLTGTGNVAR